MKKGLLVCAAALVLAVLVAAPASAATNIKFGIKAGASSSNVKWTDDAGDETSVTELTFGGFVIFELSPTLAIQPEVNYLVTGEKWDITDGTNVENFTYLHIPILLRARLMKEGKFVPVVFAGPAIGFLLSARRKELTGGDSESFDVKEFFKSTDFGVGLRLGRGDRARQDEGPDRLSLLHGFDQRIHSAPPLYCAENMMAAPLDCTMKNAAFSLTAGIIF